MEKNKQASSEKKLLRARKIKVILMILLIISTGSLMARVFYQTTRSEHLMGKKEENTKEKNSETSDTEFSGNILETKNDISTISLYKGNAEGNERFEVQNMFPGDTETKYFCVKVSHEEDVDLTFRSKVIEETKYLKQILYMKVTHLETNHIVYAGTFENMELSGDTVTLSKNSENQSTACYKVEIFLPTSAGNEYQTAMLKADLEWFIKNEEGLVKPETGDGANLFLWSLAAAFSTIVVLLSVRRIRERRNNES